MPTALRRKDDDVDVYPSEQSPMRRTRSSLLCLALTGCASASAPEYRSAPPGVEVWRHREGEPTKLTSYGVRKGIARVIPKIEACGDAHGAAPGSKLRMKFMISGRTGRVSSAEALAPWTGSALEECVIEVMAQAEFSVFEDDTLGVVYPFLL